MVKTNGTVFVVGEGLSRDSEAQLRYLRSALQSRGERSGFSEVRLRDGERLQENLRASASAVFVGRVPIDLINLARASNAVAIYWGSEVEKSESQSFAQLCQIIAAADVLLVATPEETIAPAELANPPVVAVGRGVPAAGKKTPVKEALTVVDADAHDSLAYAELLRLIDQCDVLIAGQSWMAVLESLARGKCVAVRRSHPFAGKILDGVNGIVLSDEAPKNLEREIANKVRGRLSQISLAAKRTWEAEFRIDQVCARLLVLLDKAERREFQRERADKSYDVWVARFDSIGSGERAAIRRQLRALRRHPLISIVLPVYNPDPAHLSAAVGSVRAQLYQNWELCLADDASTDPGVAPLLRETAASDARIKVIFREKNGHIAACSNSALALATGEWIALLDQDDLLAEHALAFAAATIVGHPDAGLIYSDEDKIGEAGARTEPYFKSDWNPELFLVQNFINHLGLYRRDLLREIGGFRDGFGGSQDYDLALRVIQRLRPQQILHIPRVLYHWRKIPGSLAATANAKEYAHESARRAIREYLSQTGIKAQVVACPENSAAHRILYELPGSPPLVSIVIPTRDQPELLRQCIESIRARTSYPRFDFVIVDNDSRGAETKMLLDELRRAGDVTVIEEKSAFNFSRLVNTGVDVARGEFVALVNDDVVPQDPEWLGEMVSHLLQPGVGAVGARLWYPDGRLQHGGVIIGLGGAAGHAHYGWPRGHAGYFNRAILQQDFSAITAACMLVSKSGFEALGGFDQQDLAVSFNDVDFCLRMTGHGLRIVWTPQANLLHHESASRGRQFSEKQKWEFRREAECMQARWSDKLAHDPFYNPNLSLGEPGGFTLAWPPRLPPLGVSLNSVTGDVLGELF